ncbi:LPS-assembly protein LptD [Pelagibacterales bacterium SAG-MED32]|nr:LPS-assembly protein LptD [Pelagibacterales bacterium SAG-MED32]|tara:strand:+ start:428 stop:2515 length:2088 start_codon:yes stop_codon:yes gene_type:complete
MPSSYKLIKLIFLISSLAILSLHYGNTNADQKINIFADEIKVDKVGEKVKASGNAIAVNENDIKINADEITYNRAESKLDASGNVILNDEQKNTFFFDKLSSSNNLNDVNGYAVKARLKDGSRIIGSSYRKKDEVSIINDTEFTPCKKGDYLIKNCPGWKLKSKKIYHNDETKTMHYDHAQIQLFNIPVFYLPYFSHPDPSVKKRSGFLMPTIQTDKQLGDTFSIPFFLNIKSNLDLTLTPNIQTTSNNFYNLNYRQLTNHARLEINTSIDDNNDDSGTSSHLFFDSTIFNPYGNLNAYLKTSNNDTYMRKNKINHLTVLKSGIDFQREDEDTFFSIETIGYKHLTVQDEQWEYLYPNINYNIQNIENDLYDGNISLNNSLTIRKNLDESYLSLVSSQLNWGNQKVNKNFGLIADNEANFRVTSISIDEKSKKDSNNIRIYPQISTKISYPLIKTSSSVNQIVTPIFMPIIAPYNNYTSAKTVTNSNLFSTNRATSKTEWEGGPRINYGIEWFVDLESGADIKTIIGQNYRFNKSNSDVNDEISHYFVNSNITMNTKNYLDTSIIVDRDDLKTRGLSANSYNELGNMKFAINYDYSSGKYAAPREQIAVGGKYTLDKNLFLNFTGSKNLDTNKNIGYQYGILYENDCLGIDFNYYRDLTKDRDIEESDGFSFTIVLKPFGSTKNYGKNIVFGPKI